MACPLRDYSQSNYQSLGDEPHVKSIYVWRDRELLVSTSVSTKRKRQVACHLLQVWRRFSTVIRSRMIRWEISYQMRWGQACGRSEREEVLSWMPRGCTGFCVLLPFKTKLTPINSPLIFFYQPDPCTRLFARVLHGIPTHRI